jgi:hypothetical protein
MAGHSKWVEASPDEPLAEAALQLSKPLVTDSRRRRVAKHLKEIRRAANDAFRSTGPATKTRSGTWSADRNGILRIGAGKYDTLMPI